MPRVSGAFRVPAVRHRPVSVSGCICRCAGAVLPSRFPTENSPAAGLPVSDRRLRFFPNGALLHAPQREGMRGRAGEIAEAPVKAGLVISVASQSLSFHAPERGLVDFDWHNMTT
ncbi:hypothetical protein [Martelella sp. HB161492]|uniref:hypothetical protein n=1 Tax=Martelella sp. HB161492 TaxID=2720726 RepID=UPI001591C024|nr:hypothetical protein [Martelella sp. HB161492]